MISLLSGHISSKSMSTITLLTTGGVGYDVTLTKLYCASLCVGAELTIHTYMRVTDSAMQLYGFEFASQRTFFTLLLSVSGVGPKSAMNVLALGSIDQIQSAIASSDVAYLTAVQGLGKKTAERMVVELKAKVQSHESEANSAGSGSVLSEVIDGLMALGYAKEDARRMVQGVSAENKTTEEMLRAVLRGDT
jgi:holliday junction DNA helicase RuvA